MTRALFIGFVSCLLGSTVYAAALFSAERSLPIAEQQWLNKIERAESWQALMPQVADVQAQPPVQWQLQPELTGKRTYVIRLSSKRLTYPVFNGAITIEQSGHAIALPALPDVYDPSELKDALAFWLSRDLSELVRVLQATQAELGWSDYELLQLLTLYSAHLGSSAQQQAFIASFWRQAGYGIRLWQTQNEWNLMVRLRHQAQVSMLIEQNQAWISPTVALPKSTVQVSLALPGQGMRMAGLHPRYSGRDIAAIPFVLPAGSQHEVIAITIPVHWQQVPRLPLTVQQQFLQPQPNVIYQQLSGLFRAQNSMAQTQQFIDFIRANFTSVDSDLSLHQSWITKQSTAQTRLLLLYGWWQSQVRGAAAIIVNGQSMVLAVSSSELTEANATLLHRGKYWQLWSSELNRLDTVDVEPSQWIFL